MKNVQYIDHTGDVGIIVKSPSPVALFGDCARAMFQFICPEEIKNHHISHTVTITAPDVEQLLVDWLSELNFLFHTKQFLLADITELKINDLSLCAKISGDKLIRQNFEIIREIKAVTFHKLYVKHINDFWQTQVIFDI